MSGFTYEPDFEAGVFAEGIGTIYPQTIKLSCDYTVNHTHGLGWTPDKKKRQARFPYADTGMDGTDAAASTTGPTADDTSTSAEAEATANALGSGTVGQGSLK